MNNTFNHVSSFLGILLMCAPVASGEIGVKREPASAALVAEAYFVWTLSALSQAETNMPVIAEAAQVAADAFVAGRDLGVRGGAGLNEELGARSGGLCVYRATKGNPGDVVLYAFGVATDKDKDVSVLLDRELSDAEALKAAGSTVIGLASFRQLEALGKMDRAKEVCTALMDNGGPAGDGLFTGSDGKPAVPTFVTADAIFMSGGDVAAGMETLRAAGLVPLLAERHAAGVPFVGLSAGSIMLSQQWIAWSDPDDDATAAPFDCLGFAPLLCDTHAEEDDWNELRALLEFQQPGTRGYGITSRAMLRVHPDGRTEAIGGDVVCLERTVSHRPPRDA